jgi:hypothetical protein
MGRGSWQGWVAGVALAAAAPEAVAGDSCVTTRGNGFTGEVITFAVAGDRQLAAASERALASWRRACGAAWGRELPLLRLAATGERAMYTIRRGTANRPGVCGSFRGSVLTVHQVAIDARSGGFLQCGDLADVIAHEIGHTLGLADAEARLCPLHIMAGIEPANRAHRSVQPAECAAVARTWTTWAELRRDAEPGDGAATTVARVERPAERPRGRSPDAEPARGVELW